ncbi:hypothetical protein LBMAG43_14340 [Methylococcaceae bacterium]|jgi:uncharacterized protein YqhQ|nr:hypothetical protein [Methylococcales bacterium]GDX85392.1 hypothetical protein LBMAG43_14340 [Methylococcaceae bacterium]
MSNHDDQENKNDPLADSELDEVAASPFKSMLVIIGILGLAFSIFTLLPMFFTLLSEGDYRP